MEAGKLAPPTLQVNTRESTTIATIAFDPFRTPVSPRSDGSPSNLSTAVDDLEWALSPDPGTEGDFVVDNNPFAFSPGQLNKLFNPKSLSAFQTLGGLQGLEVGLRGDRRAGLYFDEASRHDPEGPKEKLYEIHGHLEDDSLDTVAALPDTGAKFNFITESYANARSLPIQRGVSFSVKMDAVRSVTTVGRVTAHFRFRGESERYSLDFEVLPKGPYNLILGKPFMKASRTFSNLKLRASRVKVRLVKAFGSLRLFYLGDSAPRFTGLLNGRTVEALADSGAKGLFMSESYAISRGLDIVRDPKQEVVVQFADGSTRKTLGMVYDVKWEFGLRGNVDEHTLDFHVLRDSPANVILSDNFLYDTKAFAAYDRYLIDEDVDEDEEGYLFAIKLFKRKVQQDLLTSAKDHALYEEAHLLAQEDQRLHELHRAEALNDSSRNSSLQPNAGSAPSQYPTNPLPGATAMPNPITPTTPSPPPKSPSNTNQNLLRSKPPPHIAAQAVPPTSIGNNTPAPIPPTAPPSNYSTPPASPPGPPSGQSPIQHTNWRERLARKMKRAAPATSP